MGKVHLGLALAAVLAMQGAANAALYDRGGGLIYDDVLDITWLQHANLAASNTFGLQYNTLLGDHPSDQSASSYSEVIYTNGRMTWGGALHWIDAMNADGGSGYLGFNDWRLPTMLDTGGSDCSIANYSGENCGYNVKTTSGGTVYSEMATLFYDTLGNLAYADTSGASPQPGWSSSPNVSFTDGLTGDPASFLFLESFNYWTGLEYADAPSAVWRFDFYSGFQTANTKDIDAFAWAVRDGDVTSVPIPAAAWLFGSVVALGLTKLRRPS